MSVIKTFLLLAFVFLYPLQDAAADSFILIINYTEGEKSKDSWASDTRIEMHGNEISYSKSYSGFRTGKEVSKFCVLADTDVYVIQKYLIQNNLDKTDSLMERSVKYKSFERFCNIMMSLVMYEMSLVMYEKISKIKINGDIDELKDEPLYRSLIILVALIESYIDKC